MVDSNIIEPADEPTEWVNGIVIEKKNQTENCEFALNIDLIQSKENISTSLPRKNSFLNCREQSTFWN